MYYETIYYGHVHDMHANAWNASTVANQHTFNILEVVMPVQNNCLLILSLVVTA